jgi:hypothetical protein
MMVDSNYGRTRMRPILSFAATVLFVGSLVIALGGASILFLQPADLAKMLQPNPFEPLKYAKIIIGGAVIFFSLFGIALGGIAYVVMGLDERVRSNLRH